MQRPGGPMTAKRSMKSSGRRRACVPVPRLVVRAESVVHALIGTADRVPRRAGHAREVGEDADAGADHLGGLVDVVVHADVQVEPE